MHETNFMPFYSTKWRVLQHMLSIKLLGQLLVLL